MRKALRVAAAAALSIALGTSSLAAPPAARAASAGTPNAAGAASTASPSRRPAAAASAAAKAAAKPIEFTGTLESGQTYVADFAWDGHALHIWRPMKDVKVAREHAWTIAWTNLDKFPALKTPATRARPQRFVFLVSGVDVSSGSPMIPWNTVYRCEVIAVEAAGAGGARAAKGK